ncbi:sensor histidine kinase [Actinomadura verrucosospora]|uniref:histidine kinase n=1 Tax=Actinomadura verrucosospora TaxID=46165 RepID=A0A7D3ZLM5_ACTVE|nr:histidine kinase [Actinomadura verrucosospora]QKG23221.1 signal transduction histidine kinase-like protein [Actinomadura verrucosospora]
MRTGRKEHGVDRADVTLAFVAGVPLAGLSAVVAVLSVPGARAATLLAAAVAAHVALAGRRARPLASHAAVCAMLAVQAAVTGLFLVLPSVLVFPLSLYAVTAYGRRTSGPATGAVTGVLGSCLVAARFAGDASVHAAHLGPDPWTLLALLLAIAAATWSMGLVRRTQLASARAAAEQAAALAAERARHEERNRIAREMHDVIAHSLAVIVSQAKAGRYAPDHAAGALAAIEDAGRAALTDVRGLLGVLRPAGDPRDGDGPQPALRDLPALLDRVRSAGLDVRRTDRGAPRPLSPAAELAAYRLVQEGLTNTVKHAGVRAKAGIALVWGADALTITVRDDGPGPAPGRADGAPGRGLAGMRERLGALGGAVSSGAGETGGYVVEGRLPYPEAS